MTGLDLIREVPGSSDFFEFLFGKIHDVLYHQMTGLRRTRLHAQVADVLSRSELYSKPMSGMCLSGNTYLTLVNVPDDEASPLNQATEH